MKDKLYGALSLCRRAGALTTGFEAVCEKAMKGEAHLILLAADTSEGTGRRVNTACEGLCPIKTMPLSQQDVFAITHKTVGVFAVTDKDLTALCLSAMRDEEEPV